MSVLQPEIDKGNVVVGSGQTQVTQTATDGWKAENAQRRMDALLTSTYNGNKTLDGVLSPNDTLARAIITSVKGAGKPLPVVTGQDSEVESVKSIVAGEQYMTINKDTRNLVKASIDMVKALQSGGPAGQRHHVVQQRRQGRPGLPAAAGGRHQGQRGRGVRQRPDAVRADQVISRP